MASDTQLTHSPRSLPEALTRVLRHEVGDLLQTVYASVAILQRRLPPELAQERRILGDLRTRAENCRKLLDTVNDFVTPAHLTYEDLDLRQFTARVAADAAARFPQVEIRAATPDPVPLRGDAQRIGQIGEQLLTNACQFARARVEVAARLDPEKGQAEWTFTDDGPGVQAEQLPHLVTPFATSRHGHVGLGLATARKLAEAHGGTVTPENLPGGFRVRVLLPTIPPPRRA